jgi:predicted RNase H-like HicB family nuclease
VADEVTTHRAVVTREGNAWLADVPDVPGAHTWARDLVKLDKNVREVIALMLDLPDGAESGLDIEWDYRTGSADLDDLSATLRSRRAEAERVARELADRTSRAVAEFVKEGFSLRDIAGLTGLSYQRVGQLLGKAATTRRASATTKSGAKKAVPAKSKTKRAATRRRQAHPAP